VGESGNSASNTFVDGTDFAGARDNPRNFLNRAPIDFRFDDNRDHSMTCWPGGMIRFVVFVFVAWCSSTHWCKVSIMGAGNVMRAAAAAAGGDPNLQQFVTTEDSSHVRQVVAHEHTSAGTNRASKSG
jgi:hypothetical protein